MHDIFVLLNLVEAVNVAIIILTPSDERVLDEKITSPPDNPIQLRITDAPLGTAQVNSTVDCRLTFLATGNSENTASFPVAEWIDTEPITSLQTVVRLTFDKQSR